MSDNYEEGYLDDASSLECIEHAEQKKVRYLQKYKKEWELDYKFRDWLEPIQNDPYSAYCNVCCSSLTARKKDLMDHGETRKHRKNLVYKRNNPALYHKMMQNIREVDANVIMDKSIPWQPDAIKCLISQVEQQHDLFYDANVKKSMLFAIISAEMNKAGFLCVPSECQRKWESLRKSYERVLQYQVKGEFKSRFPYFNMIHRFLAKDIDPLGMREKMLCQKLGRPYHPNDPLILDGNLDGTEYRTTIISSKRDPLSVSINNTDTTTEITISSCDLIDENEDLENDRIVGINADDLVQLEMENHLDAERFLEEGQIIDEREIPAFGTPIKVGPDEDLVVREWEEGAVDALLAVMGEINFSADMMLAKGKFQDSFWEEVSHNLLKRYCEVSSLECRYKWRQLLGQYKRMFERRQRLGGRKNTTVSFKYYDCVGRILEKIHSVKTPGVSRIKRNLDDTSSEDMHPAKRRQMRAGRGRGQSRNSFSSDHSGSYYSPSVAHNNSRTATQIKKNHGQYVRVSGIAEHIKKEKEDVPDVDDEDHLMNEADDMEDDEAGLDNGLVGEPKLSIKLMQTNLLRVTQRIEMLEKEIAKKNDSLCRNVDHHSQGPQMIDLLTKILLEMKKMNSTTHKCCNAACGNNIADNGAANTGPDVPSIMTITSDSAGLPSLHSSTSSSECTNKNTIADSVPSSLAVSPCKFTKNTRSINESDSLRKLVTGL
ncbi:uncharacterized protein LOC108682972 [Hyalella azteca]|uniref:Uncharacterized protein LOC108682972 n=1 Tax=Hyalella azteca TaxID=294128 RepID=A0A8B7PNE9_HYAAZ|nr:uncharacterized protein LOC108682972 [Hyalella azteca]